ncbi:hypothetical protein ABT330_06555 [Streptomyces sp. NPDC000658]|uniref:hypothetical protein n=1 Tax=Streptomyces sp. NPDC000658 TaxID=3154266 RepID=UPI00331F0308
MIATPGPACSCCGTPVPDEERIDARFGLPDAALEVPEEARREVGVAALLRVDGCRPWGWWDRGAVLATDGGMGHGADRDPSRPAGAPVGRANVVVSCDL